MSERRRNSDRYVSLFPLPTPYEREVLTILIEECAEVQQRATKLLRFGRDENELGDALTNAERLAMELGDLVAMIKIAAEAGLISLRAVEQQEPHKREKLAKYMQQQPRGAGP